MARKLSIDVSPFLGDLHYSNQKYGTYARGFDAYSQKIPVMCDCGHEFSCKPYNLYEFGEHIIVEGFECKECGRWHIKHITNNKIRRMKSDYFYALQDKRKAYKSVALERQELLRVRGKISQDIQDRQKKQLERADNAVATLEHNIKEETVKLKAQFRRLYRNAKVPKYTFIKGGIINEKDYNLKNAKR